MPGNDSDAYWDAEIDAWVRYFSAYTEWFGERMVPASEADVLRLEKLAGRRFPAELRAFLRRMGHTQRGALDPFMEDYIYGIDAVAKFYQAPRVPAPPEAVYLWTLGGDCEMFLDTAQEPPYPVIGYGWYFGEYGAIIPGSHHPYIYHGSHSLMQFLYCEAFRWLRVRMLAHKTRVQRSTQEPGVPPTAARIGQFRELAVKLGFSSVPYMTGELAYYNRDDASFMLYPGSEDRITIHAKSERELGRLREILVDQLDMYALQ
ncbi:SMI1/KNR4 family protein [Nannocystis sp. RBIL2]|uniref:SMI1/KNR4 family protein n=1 Tax=Nannocystis sp. RBIL2 TaxID=2996788 RepID=UPI00226F32BE|nr:SMI1/KNR4 family protein [Nannocystis sp. RBIL2]MCY1071182.1 SMI1/KNR4 family protein [Nannocystis sp. RBIL2]